VSLRALDDKQPCMGKVWLIMKTLEQHVLSLRDPSFELPSNLVNVIENQIYHSWRCSQLTNIMQGPLSIHICWVELAYMMMHMQRRP
jgi:hypothetical protein